MARTGLETASAVPRDLRAEETNPFRLFYSVPSETVVNQREPLHQLRQKRSKFNLPWMMDIA